MSKPRICLSMIVKDEAPVIERCLRSVLPLIDSYAIVDTGSTDGTQAVAARVLAGLPGGISEEPWTDFATARNAALDLAAASGADYALIMDADDVLVVPDGFSWPDDCGHAATAEIRLGGTTWRRNLLLKTNLAQPDEYWGWRGVLHEYAEWQQPVSNPRPNIVDLPLVVSCGTDGARRRDPATAMRDVVVLQTALEVERDPDLRRRYVFYLAGARRDAGHARPALVSFLHRAVLGGWAEEVYVSLLNAARLVRQIGPVGRLEEDDVLSLLRRAEALVPERAEAPHAAAVFCRELGRWPEAREHARRAWALAASPRPVGALFREDWVWDYGALDEFSVASYWCGDHAAARDLTLELLSRDALPPGYPARAVSNLRFSLARLDEAARGGNVGIPHLVPPPGMVRIPT